MNQLLPANASDIELKLSKVRTTEINLEKRLNTLINIDSTPDQFLNYLAIQHSVDYWRNEWSSSLSALC